MRNWNSFYEIMIFPIGILYFAMLLLGIGNMLTNPSYSVFYTVNNESLLLIAEICLRIGTFLVVNFPLYFLIRAVARRSGSATGILSAFVGYVPCCDNVLFQQFFTFNYLFFNTWSFYHKYKGTFPLFRCTLSVADRFDWGCSHHFCNTGLL